MAQFHSGKAGHENFSESPDVPQELTAEEKATRLVELKGKLAEKRKTEEEEQRQAARRIELERRKAGQMAAEAKQELKEREMLKAADQLRKDREDEKIIRARIRAEMEEEKQRKRLQQESKGQVAVEAKPVVIESLHSTVGSDKARLHIKLPNGFSLKQSFDADQRLGNVLDAIIKEHPDLSMSSTSSFMVPFPRTVFELRNNEGKTLDELGLVPSATLIFEP